MEILALPGLLFSLAIFAAPIIAAVFLLVWVHQIKANSEKQVKQNERVIQLLEELNNK